MEDRFTVEIYVDHAQEHRWRVVSANGRTLADSSEGYKNREYCEEIAATLHPALMWSMLISKGRRKPYTSSPR
jgi:uncharacterized protein YegP (UPF0339 family)